MRHLFYCDGGVRKLPSIQEGEFPVPVLLHANASLKNTSLHSRNLINIVLDLQKRLPIKPFISKFKFHVVKFKTCLEKAKHIAQNVVAHISNLYIWGHSHCTCQQLIKYIELIKIVTYLRPFVAIIRTIGI